MNYFSPFLHIYISIVFLAVMPISQAATLDAFTLPNSKSESAHQIIQLNPLMKAMSAGDKLTINLNADIKLTMTVDQVSYFDNNDVQLFMSDNQGNNAVFTLGEAASYGNINHNNESYSIHGGAQPVLTQLTHPSMPKLDLQNDAMTMPGAKKTSKEEMASLSTQALQIKSTSVITLLAVYSNDFANGFNSPLTRINQMIGFTYAALERSGILMQVELAQATQISFNDNRSNSALLNDATFSQGELSGVASLRNTVGADMVSVLGFDPGFSGSGVAWVNGGSASFAYSVARFSPVGFDSVFAHELGHNFGSGHERASVNMNAGDPCIGNGFTNFACGHGNSSNNWGTIMSRLNKSRANNVYSSPQLSCPRTGLGVPIEPCGIPQGQTGAADNVTVFNMSRLLIAEFRDSPVVTPPSDPTNNDSVIAPILPLLLDE